MANEIADAYVAVYAKMPGIEKDLASAVDGASGAVEGKGKGAGSAYGAGFKGAAAGLMASAGGLFIADQIGSFVSDSLQALARVDTLNAQTRSVIESTGGAAGVTAEHISSLTGDLERLTATEAESAQEGANMLLTFKNIKNGVGEGNDIFDQATTSLVDMSRAMGSDPKTAAVQLGKALNDPIKGISALSKVGITFTEDQQNMIKSMVEAGDVAGAQKVILGELNSQFGGSGAAYASSYAGQMDLLGHAFGDLGETILSAVMPAVQGLIQFLVPVFQWLAQNQPVLVALAAAIGITLVAAFIAWTASIWGATIALLANPVTWIILAIIALIAAIVLLVMNWDAVVAWITQVWSGFIGWITGVIDGFVGWWNAVWAAVGAWISSVWSGFVGWLQGIWSGFVGWIMGVVGGVVAWWNATWALVGAIIRAAWQMLVSTVSGIWSGFVGWIMGAVSGLVGWWNGIWGGVGRVIESVFGGIGSFISNTFNGIVSTIRRAINTVIDVINGAIRGINGVIGTVGGALGIDVSVPTIPRLAEGGIVARRPGGILANIGEGRYDEAVVPLSPGVLAGLGGGEKRVEMNIYPQQTDPRFQMRAWADEAERAFTSR